MEVDSTALPTSKDMGRGCRFCVNVTRKFTVDNSKNKVKHFGTRTFDLVFFELLMVNFRVTFMKYLWPMRVFCALGSNALSTSVQNVVTTCSQRFDQKSIAQRCQLVCNITPIWLAGLVLVSE